MVLGLLLVGVPSGIVFGAIASQNVQQQAAQLQADLRQATVDGVDESQILPIQNQLADISVASSWEDPAKAHSQLLALQELRRDLTVVYAQAMSSARAEFSSISNAWTSLSEQAQTAGLSVTDLSTPVSQLRVIADRATTPAGVRGVSGVMGGYITTVSARLTAFMAARAATGALLSEARATLQSAAQYRALKLAAFQQELDSAGKDMSAVNSPDGFGPIQGRIHQTEAGIKSLLSARQLAYAELAATRAALDAARSAGAAVSVYANRITSLEDQLNSAGDRATFSSITGQLSTERQALNGLLVVTIPAPIYQQAMALDCETSALRVGLAYYGHYYTDAQLFAAEPVDLRPPVMGGNHTILQWGNPYTAFVGNVNGVAAIPTGYGVYYPVILNVARSHGLPNTVGGEGYSAATIYAELRAHHPVEVWVEYNWASYQRGIWTAWDGTRVRYSYGEHAVTLTGVSATQVRVNDVGHGTQYWIDKSTFEISWSALDNMAVIFR